MSRTIVIGDIHGCLEEFDELLRAVQYSPRDRVILAGDLVDRGPDSAGVVRRARELGLESVLGNHDHKAVRWANWEKQVATGKEPKNRMKYSPEREKVHAGLRDEDVEWVRNLPRIIHIDELTVVVHGGLVPTRSVADQPKEVTMVRFVHKGTGHFVGIRKIGEVPEDSVYWSEVWTGPETVFYGHAVHDLNSPRVDEHDGYSCWGLDTGCVFGGRLTAAIVTDGEVVTFSTPAKKAYAEQYPSGFKFE